MAVYDSDKKLILTRILKTMILLFGVFLFYILIASTGTPIKDIKTVKIKLSQLEDIKSDVLLVKGIPIAVYTSNNKPQFINAVNKLTGCVIQLRQKKQWFDVCNKQVYALNGKAKGTFADLILLKSKPYANGYIVYLDN